MRVPRVPRRRGPAVPLWLVHARGGAAAAPDRYEVVFDVAGWAEAVRARGPRPRLLAWSGCAEVDRRGLRQTIRRVVASEFDAARELHEMRAPAAPGTRAAMGAMAGLAVSGASVALRATPAGFALGALVTLGSLALGRRGDGAADAARDRRRLEAAIAEAQAATEAALPRLDVRLHRDLYAHAWAGGPGGRMTGMDYDAWPLPLPVRRAMEDRCSARS